MDSGQGNLREWQLVYKDFKPEQEKSRESLLAIGNGYLGSRGSMEECTAGDHHYPGTYLAGLYNRLISRVSGKDIENEDFVNCPNWHLVRLRLSGEPWLEVNTESIKRIERKLDLKSGVLTREMLMRDDQGRETLVTSTRTASMANPHLLVLRYQVKALNYEEDIEIESVLDGDIINDGVPRYRDLNQQQLEAVEEGYNEDFGWIRVKTTQSEIMLAEACRHKIYKSGKEEAGISCVNRTEKGRAILSVKTKLKTGDELTLDKTVALYTSKSDDTDQPLEKAKELLSECGSLDQIIKESEQEWRKIWERMDIIIEGDIKSQSLLRLHLYHLIVSASQHNVSIDAGFPARGLHGEAYRGHIFWDELYILPLFNLYFPEITRSVLMYRFRRLDKAREYARENGFKGAMFPWQSGSDGREETQVIHLNPVSGEWGDDYSALQRHISIAVAYNVWCYNQVTGDQEFMDDYGLEMFLDICRFWASKAEKNKETGRYSIPRVMGPDEFHERHPESSEGGVRDNAYTNIMVAWLFERAAQYWDNLSDKLKREFGERMGVNNSEINTWSHIATKLKLVVSEDGVISQFDGYFGLKELDWDAYRKEYGNIYRLDRILKAEGKSPDDYKLAKQADTLMTYFNLDEEVINGILQKMGYSAGRNALRTNYDYYIRRTSHGSTLSRVVHAYLALKMGDYESGWELYKDALASDYSDIQGGTTAEGIHAGVMGGTVLMVITSFLGVNFRKNHLRIDPHLPSSWKSVSSSILFRGCEYRIRCSRDNIELEVRCKENKELTIELSGKKIVLQTNKEHLFNY